MTNMLTQSSPYYIGVDTGGTFTDFIYYDEKGWHLLKKVSSPSNPADAVIEGINEIAEGHCLFVSHGTTVATNAILEQKGARSAFITNAGFEDLLILGRQNRIGLFDPVPVKHESVIPEQNFIGAQCRILSDGSIHQPLSDNEIARIVSLCQELEIESVAICLLYSFLTPDHELQLKKALEPTGIHVSLSCEVSPEFREYERASTTAINAYVAPVMSFYLNTLTDYLGNNGFRVMQSNGGSISPVCAMEKPVHTILSGPAGGAVAAKEIGKCCGIEKFITFDMGGTSTDVSLTRSELPLTTESVVNGSPVRVPMIDIHTVGAGGGSLLSIDTSGGIHVGPESAGADPGPVCYGSGDQLTVTDANLFLGHLNHGSFLAGDMPLDLSATQTAFVKAAETAGIGPEDLAAGMLDIANEVMAQAIRLISVERGFDPRDFVLMSFGGSGGLHAVELARLLSIHTVLVPKNPGVLSAMGMLMADVKKDYVKTVMITLGDDKNMSIGMHWQSLENQAIQDMKGEGFSQLDLSFIRTLDMRYAGQSFELTLPLVDNIADSFHDTYKRRYGHSVPEGIIEIVNIRLQAVGCTIKPPFSSKETDMTIRPRPVPISGQQCWVNEDWSDIPVYDRDLLMTGHTILGPAIVTEYSSTTFLPEGSQLQVDEFENLVISV